MTTLREAAQQALEALELAHLNGRSKLRRQKLVDSIDALRATLAQPDPVMCSNTFACQCPKHFTALRAALAEPDTRRWNIERDGEALLICDGQHEKHESCEYKRYVLADGDKVAPTEPVGIVTQLVKGGVTWNRWPSDMPDGTKLYNAPPTAEPVQEPVAIKWALDGDKGCGYNNWLGETPFGRILITWKGWKASPDACVDEFPGGFHAYGNPNEVRAACEAEFAKRLGVAPPQRKPLTDEEIYKMYNELWRAGSTEAVAFARAIERAHGVTP